MIRDLSRLPESSMLGLKCKNSSETVHAMSFNQSIKSNQSSPIPRQLFFFLLYEISYRIGTLLLQRGSQASNPAIVALKGTAKDQLLSHNRGVRKVWEEETMKGDRERTRSERGRSRAIVVVLSAAVSTR